MEREHPVRQRAQHAPPSTHHSAGLFALRAQAGRLTRSEPGIASDETYLKRSLVL
jgi:hypothetical protein